jgi:hypothetical protein
MDLPGFCNLTFTLQDSKKWNTKILSLEMFFSDAFLSAATLVAADYGFTCPPRFMSGVVVVVVGGTDGN